MKNPALSQPSMTSVESPDRPYAGPSTATLDGGRKSDGKLNRGHSQPEFQPVSERFPTMERQAIILAFESVDAKEVKVGGSFNDWQPNRTPMKKTGAGEWSAGLMLRSGQYEYRLVVDGRWIEDPCADQRVANSYGGFNSILVVPLAIRTSIL
jgi:hypothetical protein